MPEELVPEEEEADNLLLLGALRFEPPARMNGRGGEPGKASIEGGVMQRRAERAFEYIGESSSPPRWLAGVPRPVDRLPGRVGVCSAVLRSPTSTADATVTFVILG